MPNVEDFGVKMAIRLPDDSVLFITGNRTGGIIPTTEGQRIDVRASKLTGKMVYRVGDYKFSERDALALTSCLLSLLYGNKEPKNGD